ncbi:MAG TPA: hypothetical protein IGR64_03960 [Leptolyngbyaceae cyanobacterium M65_K2018_010]|nr:hypothetical protein [Leptolyngbyaceae cyanobacterium M65_K2018_010]
MIALVLGFNCLVALGGGYLAWRLWRWRRALARWADQCSAWEASLRDGGREGFSPTRVLPGLATILGWRQRYAYGQLFWGQAQQLIRFVTVLMTILRWLVPPRRRATLATRLGRPWHRRKRRSL